MAQLPRRFGLSAARLCSGVLVLGCLALGGWLAGDAPAGNRPGLGRAGERRAAPPAGKQRDDEEEEEGSSTTRPRHKIVRVEEDRTKKPVPAKGSRSVVPETADLGTAARTTRNPLVKKLFQELSKPYDLIVLKKGASYVTVGGRQNMGGKLRVAPIPPYVGENAANLKGPQKVTVLEDKGAKTTTRTLYPRDVERVLSYEEIALGDVKKFLEMALLEPDDKNYVSPEDKLLAVQLVLSSVIRWHESAQSTGVRAGEGWDEIEKSLRGELLSILLKQLEDQTRARHWNEAFALAHKLADAYHDPKDQAKIVKPLTELLNASLRANALTGSSGLSEVQKRLHTLTQLFPNNPDIEKVAKGLRDQAEALLDAAREAEKKKDPERAQEYLKQAEETWPDLPGLRAYRMELNRSHPLLRVGVRQLPRYLAPGWAWTDSEVRGVEMLFEGLVLFNPVEAGGGRYEPALARSRPRVIPLGRQFLLPPNVYWSDGERLDGTDVRQTVRLYQQRHDGAPLPGQQFLSPAWGELMAGAAVRQDAFHVNLTLRQSYLEPLALMTFKILPYHIIRGLKDGTDWERFAQHPVGSGPFAYVGTRSEAGGREYAGFLANPAYGIRPGKAGLPAIREVRLFAHEGPVEGLKLGHLDMALGLTAEQAAAARKLPGVRVPLPGPGTSNRRVYFLAVNHRKAHLDQPEVRRALAYAIQRDAVLDTCFRGPLGSKVHAALNGPFPARSWACCPDVKPNLYNPEAALSEMKKARLENITLRLKYPRGDAETAKAMALLARQVKDARVGIDIVLEDADPWDLRRSVEETQSYELAYYHYDFPDETYWLWPLLGPGNYLNYTSDQVQTWLRTIMSHRSFAAVRQAVHTLHRDILGVEMPLIPLWQLDPLAAIAEDRVDTGPFDPLLVFTDVEHWRLTGK